MPMIVDDIWAEYVIDAGRNFRYDWRPGHNSQSIAAEARSHEVYPRSKDAVVTHSETMWRF